MAQLLKLSLAWSSDEYAIANPPWMRWVPSSIKMGTGKSFAFCRGRGRDWHPIWGEYHISTTRGAGMAQWWEHLPPTTVAQVRFPDPASHVGWVCYWFSSLHQGFFSRYSSFPPSTKTNTPNSNSTHTFDHHVKLKCVLQTSSIYLFISLVLYQ